MIREIHEYAKRYPILPQNELESLAADIEANGLIEPIVLYEDKILDGRNRYAACKMIGLDKIKMIKFAGSDEEAINFVISKNYHRRHLTESQRTMEAARILQEQKINPGNTKKTVDEVAKEMKVSPANVKKATKILKESPEKATQVSQGAITVAKAHDEVDNKSQYEIAMKKGRTAISALNNINKEFRKEIFEMVKNWIDENITTN